MSHKKTNKMHTFIINTVLLTCVSPHRAIFGEHDMHCNSKVNKMRYQM
jgi:pantothenate synthetase